MWRKVSGRGEARLQAEPGVMGKRVGGEGRLMEGGWRRKVRGGNEAAGRAGR